MVYIPEIIDYKPFYIQTDADSNAIDTLNWGLVAKTNPFPAMPSPKEPYKNEWLDEEGDDEYVEKMYYEAYEFEVTFYIKATGDGSARDIVESVEDFFNKVRQKEFKIYDSYTGIGRRKVRYAGFKEEEYKSGKDWQRAIFTIRFRANDPITRVVYENGQLVELK